MRSIAWLFYTLRNVWLCYMLCFAVPYALLNMALICSAMLAILYAALLRAMLYILCYATLCYMPMLSSLDPLLNYALLAGQHPGAGTNAGGYIYIFRMKGNTFTGEYG